ncbi:MAG TPA: hypothetical protein VGY54_17040 [Polyangiaceae bacterium]|nr:hypothetical protein [Polyangiaceae bacterium]
MRRMTDAAIRFAERRRREDEAPRLREVVPELATLKLEVEERHGAMATSVGAPKHVRLVVVDNAPALFALPCGDASCRDGGYDVTDGVLRHLRAREGQFELEDSCMGNVGTASCGRTLHLTAIATYR